MPQPQLVQVALDAQGHNAIGVDRDGGVWRGRIQRDRAGEEFIVWKRMRSEFPAEPKENRDEERTPTPQGTGAERIGRTLLSPRPLSQSARLEKLARLALQRPTKLIERA